MLTSGWNVSEEKQNEAELGKYRALKSLHGVWAIFTDIPVCLYCFIIGKNEQRDLLHLNLISKNITSVFIIWLENVDPVWKLSWAWWSVLTNFLNFFLFEFQKIHNGVSHFQNPSGKTIDVQWDIWLLPAQGLPVQECSNLPGKIKQYIPERSCWNGTVSIRSW